MSSNGSTKTANEEQDLLQEPEASEEKSCWMTSFAWGLGRTSRLFHEGVTQVTQIFRPGRGSAAGAGEDLETRMGRLLEELRQDVAGLGKEQAATLGEEEGFWQRLEQLLALQKRRRKQQPWTVTARRRREPPGSVKKAARPAAQSAASSTPKSPPAASSAPESSPAASSVPESPPAASSAPADTPAASSAPADTPAAPAERAAGEQAEDLLAGLIDESGGAATEGEGETATSGAAGDGAEGSSAEQETTGKKRSK